MRVRHAELDESERAASVELLEELARQRAAFEEARTSLSGFLAAVHDEVSEQGRAPEGTPDEALEAKSET